MAIRPYEIAFTAARDHAEPYVDVEMWVDFVKGETTVRRPAFWDGSRRWKVRFAAP